MLRILCMTQHKFKRKRIYLLLSFFSFIHPTCLANDQLEQVGDQLQFIIPLSAAAISLTKGDMEGVGQLVEGAIWTSAATHLLKFAVDAPRPDGSDNNSFPSGHTSAAMQGAAYLQFRYGWRYGVPAYLAGGVVGYSRVESQRHYWRDVVAGTLLATGIQYAITIQGASVTNLVLVPIFDGDEVGLTAMMNF